VCALARARGNEIDTALTAFETSYAESLGPLEVSRVALSDGDGERDSVVSEKLRGPGNYPNVMHHGRRTTDAIVLIHGLTDSPFYMDAIGRRFLAAGCNVVLPLLPAHGLKDPDQAMEDDELAEKWKATVDQAVAVAHLLGDRVSIGGFSTGGALSVNIALRHPDQIDGAIFLFSGALNIGTMNQLAGKSKLLAPALTRREDGIYRGEGPNPYKYPVFTLFGALQLTKIIAENNALLKQHHLRPAVFAAHSLADTDALIQGIGELFRQPGVRGLGFVIAEDPPVPHASVVLAEDIPLDLSKQTPGAAPPAPVRANPWFGPMMDLAMVFFRDFVTSPPAPAQPGSPPQPR
jgi:pimeloyl-ACP methyl ester carboxylesterase